MNPLVEQLTTLNLELRLTRPKPARQPLDPTPRSGTNPRSRPLPIPERLNWPKWCTVSPSGAASVSLPSLSPGPLLPTMGAAHQSEKANDVGCE